MGLQTGIYEVLSSDETSYVHGDHEGIATTHMKLGWLKDLSTENVTKITLTNFPMPLVPGAKIAIAFLNGEIIAFKRSRDIPVESPFNQKSLASEIISAAFVSLLLSIPVVGYIGGLVAGTYFLLNGGNILGNYKKMKGNRTYSAFLILMSAIPWFPAMYKGGGEQMVKNYLILASVLMLVTVTGQIIKVRAERKYFARAAVELNSAWHNTAINYKG